MTDRNGIVKRNCATIAKSEDGCEIDVHGNELCYCLSNLCNHAARNVPASSLLISWLSLAALAFYSSHSS